MPMVPCSRPCCKICCKTVDTRGSTRSTVAHEIAVFVLVWRHVEHLGTPWNRLQTVFKTVARPASWSRVGSTPMHLRHEDFELKTTCQIGADAKLVALATGLAVFQNASKTQLQPSFAAHFRSTGCVTQLATRPGVSSSSSRKTPRNTSPASRPRVKSVEPAQLRRCGRRDVHADQCLPVKLSTTPWALNSGTARQALRAAQRPRHQAWSGAVALQPLAHAALRGGVRMQSRAA